MKCCHDRRVRLLSIISIGGKRSNMNSVALKFAFKKSFFLENYLAKSEWLQGTKKKRNIMHYTLRRLKSVLKTRTGGNWKSCSWQHPDGAAGRQQTQVNWALNVPTYFLKLFAKISPVIKDCVLLAWCGDIFLH